MNRIFKYFRRKRSDTWHWMTECSNFPLDPSRVAGKIRAGRKRPDGDLCNQCRSKEHRLQAENKRAR